MKELKFLASIIVSPDESEPRALASGIPLPDGRGSDSSGKIMTEAKFLEQNDMRSFSCRAVQVQE